MKTELRFVIEKETKGAIRYVEVDDADRPKDLADATIGTLYVRKSYLQRAGVVGNDADYVTVTLDYGERHG